MPKKCKDIVPIEWFYRFPERFQVAPIKATFLSSGTTAPLRSKSHFSPEGLKAYEETLFYDFFSLLSHFFSKPQERKGFSLIPEKTSWPDSSLAHMVFTLSQKLPLTYVTGDSLVEALAKEEKPVWVFATALHFLDCFERGLRCPLPKGSIVIETGGLKSSKRAYSRPDIYQAISTLFAVEPAQIVSEYGMCELASQAYDFVPKGEEWPLEQRRFRFLNDTQVLITDPNHALHEEGIGCLTLRDARRIDLKGLLRTQDLVELNQDGSFRLLGRVPHSVLKGCSSKVEPLAPPRGNPRLRPLTKKAPQLNALLAALKSLLNHKPCWQELGREIWSQELAERERHELAKTILSMTKEQWQSALAVQKGNPGDRLLIILPKNHSLVSLYPLSLACLMGARVTIRLPLAWSQTNVANPTVTLIRCLKAEGFAIETIGADFELTTDTARHFHRILLYGQSQTIETLTQEIGAKIHGFGSVRACGYANHLPPKEVFPELAASLFSLGQRGCLSPRAVFLDHRLTPDEAKEFVLRLRAALAQIAIDIPWDHQFSLAHEALRYRDAGFDCPYQQGQNGLVFLLDRFDDSLWSSLPYVMPVVRLAPEQTEWWLRNTAPFQQIYSLMDGLSQIWPPWDGYHLGVPLMG